MYKPKHPEETIHDIIKRKLNGMSNREVAEIVLGRRSANSTIHDIWKAYNEDKLNIDVPSDYDTYVEYTEEETKPYKIMFLDVEVSPSVALVFDRRKAFVSPDAVIQEPYMLTFSYCYGDGTISTKGLDDYPYFNDDYTNDYGLISELAAYLDKADIVVAHNAKFDVGWFNQRCLFWGIDLPSPYKVVCTLKELRKTFSLPSNSLAHVANYFGLEQKRSNSGMMLWRKCMNGHRDAFKEMKEYNEGDVVTLRQLYYKILPYVNNHPNMGAFYTDSELRCRTCGSDALKEEGSFNTGLAKYRTFRCGCCGHLNRTRVNILPSEKKENLMMDCS